MSDFEFDDDGNDGPPPAEPNREPVKIEVELSFGEVLDRITAAVIHRFEGDRWAGSTAKIDHLIGSIVAKTIKPVVQKLVDERAAAIVDRALDEGWTEGSYGDPPKTVTVKSVLRKTLETKVRKDYNAPEKTWIEVRVDAYLEQVLAKAMQEELAEGKKRFRAAVDTLIEKNVLEAARAALKGER